MTAVAERTGREAGRHELAALLESDPAELADSLRLREDLGADSLTMMRILVWLESKGVSVDTDLSRPARIGDLALLDSAARGLTIRIGGGSRSAVETFDLPATAANPADPLAPVLAGHGLRLDPVTPEDTAFLFALSAAPETSYRWRYRGAPPPLERFTESLWSQVLVQFVARRVEDGERVGHVVAYSADPLARFASLGAVFVPPMTRTGAAAHSVSLFVRYLFHTFPFVKVYMEIPGYNWPQMASGEGVLFTVEGRLRDHYQYAGRSWDQYLCAIYRDASVRPSH